MLASEYGYNFRAEALRSPAVEAGDVAPTTVPMQPLAPGEKDIFRMVFFRTDVPRFDRWRVRILEVRCRPAHELQPTRISRWTGSADLKLHPRL